MARETIEYIVPTDLDDIPDGTTYKRMSGTEQTKLGTVAENATVDQDEANLQSVLGWSTTPEDGATADQTGAEMQTAIVGLDDADRVLIGSEPLTGEKQIYGLHINASGNIEADQDTTAES